MKRAELPRLLPTVLRRSMMEGDPLSGLLDVMAALHAPGERALEELDATFDPDRAPDPFVPALARWVGLEPLVEAHAAGLLPTGRLRVAVGRAASSSALRGTAAGLIALLELATGEAPFTIVEEPPGSDGEPVPFHVVVRVPAAAAGQRALIERILAWEKPAHVTAEVAYGGS